jgi:hypothetical protein
MNEIRTSKLDTTHIRLTLCLHVFCNMFSQYFLLAFFVASRKSFSRLLYFCWVLHGCTDKVDEVWLLFSSFRILLSHHTKGLALTYTTANIARDFS